MTATTATTNRYRIKPDNYSPHLIVEKQRHGHTSWNIAAGPFGSKEAAKEWIDEDIRQDNEMDEFRRNNPIEYYP